MENNKSKVLIVDDEPNNLHLLSQILHNQYQLSFATSGIKALDIAQQLKPDIILLDIMMPGMDGYETCRQLKAAPATAKVPVIFVSTMMEVDDEQQGFEAGGVDYITKPISAPIVQARVKTHLALYNQNRMLEEMVQQRTKQLQDAFKTIKNASLDTIHRLSRAAEFKDEETYAHIVRMSHYSAAITRKMGMPEEFVESILYASPMHDVGKIGIPDRILLKPDRLDSDEWEIMKQHTINGGKILSGSEKGFIKMAETIALTHHEKWDGSGYPKGLKGEEIPQVGRIVAIADVFDALTTKRPYKDPYPLDMSLSLIKKARGAHFDPAVVDAFLEIQDEILAIKKRYEDEDCRISDIYSIKSMIFPIT